MFGKGLKKTRQILGRIDLDHSELPNALVVTAEILESASEAEGTGDRCSQRHRSQIIFATAAAKSLLQIDVSDFVRCQLPLFDKFRPQHGFIHELVAPAHWANRQGRR
jgi:hypothetical protein